MSVLIKGMTMPKNCNTCLLSCSRSLVYIGKGEERNANCPIVDVPTPHGRLIDADNLVSVIDEEFTEQTRTLSNPIEVLKKAVLCGFAKDVITAAPAIIEAEEGEDNG